MATVAISFCALNLKSPSTSSGIFLSKSKVSTIGRRKRRERFVCCEVALKSDSQVVDSSEEENFEEKIGARIKVSASLKVYHVPKVPEIDLLGMEGVIKQYIGIWKGKRISANLPFKVEFRIEVPNRGIVKFFAHLKEDEFEYLRD